VESFTYGPSGKMAVGDSQIRCIGCEGLAALGKITRRNKRWHIG